MIKYHDQEQRVLKLWHQAFKELSMEDQFKYFIKGSTSPALQRVRDPAGEFIPESERHAEIHPDAAPAAPIVDVAKIPRLSKKDHEKLEKPSSKDAVAITRR